LEVGLVERLEVRGGCRGLAAGRSRQSAGQPLLPEHGVCQRVFGRPTLRRADLGAFGVGECGDLRPLALRPLVEQAAKLGLYAVFHFRNTPSLIRTWFVFRAQLAISCRSVFRPVLEAAQVVRFVPLIGAAIIRRQPTIALVAPRVDFTTT